MYKGKGWGQIFGLFKHTHFMNRPLEQKVIKQRLRYNEIMGVKLLSAVDPQIIQNNAGKQFSTCKYRKTGKVISIFQGLF